MKSLSFYPAIHSEEVLKSMLFSKDIQPVCALCAHGSPIDEETILCHKKGPMGLTDCCRRFCYDPLLRQPAPPPMPRKKFSEKDFEL